MKQHPRPPRPPQPSPPPTRGPNEFFQGIPIIQEVPEPLGTVLWKAYRSIRLWNSTPADQRHRLFGSEAARSRALLLDPKDGPDTLRSPLQTFRQLLEKPGEILPETLANACQKTAKWAYHQGFKQTSLTYRQASGLLLPHDLGEAIHTARLAFELSDLQRAEAWYRQVVLLSRGGRNRALQGKALLGLALTLLALRDTSPSLNAIEKGPLAEEARMYALRALRAGKRTSTHSLTQAAEKLLSDLS